MNFFGTQIWTPDELNQARSNLAAIAQGTDTDVQACSVVTPADKTAWVSFYGSLKSFTDQKSGWFSTTGTNADQLQEYQRELSAWQQKLSAVCKMNTPSLSPPGVPPSLAANLTAAAGMIKWSAIGGAIVFGWWIGKRLIK